VDLSVIGERGTIPSLPRSQNKSALVLRSLVVLRSAATLARKSQRVILGFQHAVICASL
jgi:hypothetical protein